MTESDILRIWNGPTSVCNRAKILQFAADIESRIRAESAQEPVAQYEGVDMSRYTISWLNSPPLTTEKLSSIYDPTDPWPHIPVGTKFYMAPVAKPAAQDCVSIRADVVKFLNGSGQLHGLSFGDRMDGKQYWWRKYLPDVESI